MISRSLLFASLFPWDHHNESALGHHHLIAAYCFAWGLQLAYLGYVGLKWRALIKAERQTPSR
ncbi:hypothetical protein ACPOL_4864 [Acidisarcina polymorpha]|uniref:Uncharacterized protein n=1 Tax=Acidisarcina polymorpha TaxID=2211140 RepID=A0A2Z5G6F1_9BACT|nr:hypothetical protein [Acidisarcina polymorpha]AXC14126.1 hypothetical protein ACPOL_4864 [Acidisarcina polymorpha]